MCGEMMRHWAALAIALVLSAVASAAPRTETVNIVAFGDSGVFGSGQGRTPGGVPVAEAYPAKLERALRARGWDVSVSNQSVRGATAHNAVYSIDQRAILPPALKRSFAGSAPRVARSSWSGSGRRASRPARRYRAAVHPGELASR
jgi:lysophospholipase L1-like esterase